MKRQLFNRIFSAVLILCILLSSICVSSFATGSVGSPIDYDSEVARGEELGFNEFINVEEYVSNAGLPGYDNLTALRIDTPRVFEFGGGTRINWAIDIYFYNPAKLEFISEENGDIVKLDGNAYVKDNDDAAVRIYELALSYPDEEFDDWSGVNAFDDMFFKASIVGQGFSFSYEDPSYYVEKISIKDSDFDIYVLDIDQTMELKGIDYKLDVTLPDYDLSTFFDLNEDELIEQYPVDATGELSLVYLYERDLANNSYSLYLYLYNPAGVELVSLGYKKDNQVVYASTVMSDGYSIVPVTKYFTLVSSSDTLVKLKCISDFKKSYSFEIRDYYISDINLRIKNGNDLTSYVLDCEAHYEYSETPLTDIEKKQFEYVYKLQDVFLGRSFCGDDEEDVCEFLIHIDTSKDFYLSNSSGLLNGIEWDEELCCYAAHTGSSFFDLIDNYGNITFNLACNSDFPGINVDSITATIYLTSSQLGIENKEVKCTFDFAAYSSLGRADSMSSIRSSNAQIDNGVKYSRSDVKEEIAINCDSTFYRLNSSASGTSYQATLSTVGFALNSSYLNMNDYNDKNDFYVDFIRMTYEEGYLLPGLVTTDKNFLKNNGCDVESYGPIKLYGSSYIASNYKEFSTEDLPMAQVVIHYSHEGEFWLGEVPENKNYIKWKYTYYADKPYPNIPFLFIVDQEGDFEDFSYVLSQEEIEAAFENYSEYEIFDGGASLIDKIITFEDKTNLWSYRDATFAEVKESFGFFAALWHKLFGMDDTVMESESDIKCIEMITPDEYSKISTMSDEDFSSTYLVAINEASYMKQQVLDALAANKVYTFLRFDTYDYYAADATFVNLEHDGDAFIFQEKYYKDFEIIELGVSNESETVVYTVRMDPIDINAGATAPDEVEKDDITDVGEHIKEKADKLWDDFIKELKEIGKIVAIVAGCLAIVVLVIGCVRLTIYIRNARTLNKVRKRMREKPKKQGKRK